MIVPRYVPGRWYAVVTDGTIALLAPQTLPAVVDTIWEELRSGVAVDAQLQALTQGHPQELPPFALVSVVAGTLRAYLRGEVELEVVGGTVVPGRTGAAEAGSAGGSHRALGVPELTPDGAARYRGVTDLPWIGVEVAGPEAISVRIPASEHSRSTSPELPVLSGVVTASSVVLELRDVADRSPRTAVPDGADDLELTSPVGTRTRATEAPLREEATDPAADFAEFEELFGQTIMHPAARLHLVPDEPQAPAPRAVSAPTPPAALAPVPSAPAPPAPAPPVPVRPVPAPPVPASAMRVSEADHDGMTIMSSDLVEIRRKLPSWTAPEVPGPFAVPTEIPPAKLVMSSGLVVTLDRTILIGRAPLVSRVSNKDLPRLVTVESPHHDVSRTHAQVRAEGDRVFVTDLDSTNGVLLIRAGGAPERIRPQVPTVVPVGATVDIGDGVTFQLVRS